jgi:hypothetical protein
MLWRLQALALWEAACGHVFWEQAASTSECGQLAVSPGGTGASLVARRQHVT